MNLGFAGVLTEESRRADLAAAAVVLAELVFSALSEDGPTDRTSAASLRRLFEQVFTLVRPARCCPPRHRHAFRTLDS